VSKDTVLYKILSKKYWTKLFWIKWQCTKVHKYYFWDYHNIHLDTDYSKGNKRLLKMGVGRYLNIAISLTKWWQKWYGWELTFYNKHKTKIVELEPSFNTLWIYPIKDSYHEVKVINEKNDFHKYTITNLYHWLII
jgi:hypothetical protein